MKVYKQVKIGDPLEKGTLLGPLHTPASRENFVKGIKVIKAQVGFISFIWLQSYVVLSVNKFFVKVLF